MRLILPLMLAACSPYSGLTPAPSSESSSAVDSDSQGAGCRSALVDPGSQRFGAVSLPYQDSGGSSDRWEVLSFMASGELARTGEFFSMGRGFDGEIAFTPDGSLGLAVQDNGSLGVFTLSPEGVPTVVEEQFNDDGAGGTFYASSVWIDPSGERAIVLDGNWPNNGGGLIEVLLDCQTGAPTSQGMILSTKLARHLLPAPGGRHVLVATEVEGIAGDAHLVDLGTASVLSSVSLWPDDDAIVGGASWAGHGEHLVVGDISAFSGVPNRVAVAHLSGDQLQLSQVLSPLEDPTSIGAWGESTLVASGFGDRLVALGFEGGSTPFSIDGPISTMGGNPQIPTVVVPVRGSGSDGYFLVSEVTGVRVVEASDSGVMVDRGVSSFGGGVENMPGALGLPW